MPSFCAQCYLTRALPVFNKRYPGVRVELLEDSGERLEQALLDQRIDVAVLHLPVTNRELRYAPLFEERVLLAVPGSKGPDQVQQGRLEEYLNMPYILPQPEQKLGRYTAAFLADNDVVPDVFMKTQNVTTMLSLAAQGMGAAFVPEGGLRSISGEILQRLDFYDLNGPAMTVVQLRRRDSHLPAYVSYLMELLKQ